MEKNHTAYVRFKVNNSAEIMVVAVEVEVGSGAGLHWGGSSASINLGMGGSLQPPIHYPITLLNSAKKPVKVLNIISTPVSKALRIDFEPITMPGDTDTPITVGTLIYDWKAGLDLDHLKGKLVIKGLGPGGSSQKLLIPWIAEVLHGGLEINATVTHYCSPHSNQPRNFTVVNRFKLPLAITNVSLAHEAKSLFNIKNFIPKVLKPGQKENIFTLSLQNDRKNSNLKIESSIFIYSNVSTTQVPLLSYDGKVRKIIPGERENDRGTMNFGTVSSGTENEAIFALENHNPVNIELHGWGVNMPGAVLELMGCQNGPTELFNKGTRNITVCSHSGNQSIKPGYLAIFKIKVKTPMVEEDTIVGDVFVRTTYERLTVPVYMRVAHGRISLKKLIFTDCFPGSICLQQVRVHSTFARSMQVTLISPLQRDNRVKYIPLEESSSLPTISKGDNLIGSIRIDPSISCKHHCYLGLSLNTTAGSQWINTMSLPSHTRDSDLNLLNARYTRYLNSTGGPGTWDNITLRLDTTEVRGHKFYVNIKPYWPSLINPTTNNLRNKTIFLFPLTQVGNTSFKTLKILNPSTKPLFIQLVMDWGYPQGSRLYHSLPSKFKPTCFDCTPTIDGEFKLHHDKDKRDNLKKTWNIDVAEDSLALQLEPGESIMIKLSYTPKTAASSSGLLFIRNNMTILEVLRLVGRGAYGQFKFGNRKPGSSTPLLFELAEKHLKDCERERLRKNPVPNLTVKRSFTARNTGELPIDIHGFYISGLICEGYGFKVLNCGPFKLNPNATKKIEIAFTPDFTLSRVERELMILTSLGTFDGDSLSESGIVRLSLLTTVPSHTLETCASVLMRPTWEKAVQWAAISLSCILLLCILAVSFLEADRIIRGALAIMSRSSPVQPPLDLRQLATQSNSITRDKIVEEKIVLKKKEEPDWGLMNVKRGKERDQKILKIPDWSADEERRFKMDMEVKEGATNKSEESLEVQRKKKRQTEQNYTDELERKCIPPLKLSPTISRKPKKEEKPSEEIDPSSLNDAKDKRKLSMSSYNNNKKDEINPNQKVQFSEEETSSTTTESSTQEDGINYKDENFVKSEKASRKPPIKKTSKPQINSTAAVSPVDYRDNYEGDCDDDDYDKDQRQENNVNKWKTNTSKTTTKINQPLKTVDGNINKIPKVKNPPKKEKTLQKRKKDMEKVPKILNFESKPEVKIIPRVSSPLPPPPPPSCWGENRARFSDVVARNPESISPAFTMPNRTFNKPKSFSELSNPLTMLNQSQEIPERPIIPNVCRPIVEYPETRHQFAGPTHHCGPQNGRESYETEAQNLAACRRQMANSYFMNAFEQPFEPELVPYDDLPETDEPLVELESIEEDSRSTLWNEASPMMNLLDNYNGIETPKHGDKLTNLSDSLKDNWVTVETNWEPLYTRGAVGEERSGVWGVNTGGVWAAAPWGAPTDPTLQSSTHQQTEQNAQVTKLLVIYIRFWEIN